MRFFRIYLLPGFVFQGVLIGGGYATGREIVEFFMPSGPFGGLLGITVAALIFSVVMAVSFEFARTTRSYDYKTFFQSLLGKYWYFFEVLFVLLILLVLSVIAAAAGELLGGLLAIPRLAGNIALLTIIGVLAYFGSRAIAPFMGIWSFLLYLAYLILVVWSYGAFGESISNTLTFEPPGKGWLLNGIRYAGYNLAAIAVILFCLDHIKTRPQALTAGILAGPLGMLPAYCLYLAMLSQYPEINSARLPSAVLLDKLEAPWFSVLFQVILFGTFVQTGVGLVHAINERVAVVYTERGRALPAAARPLVAAFIFFVAVVLASRFGIISLIANGYGLLTYGFLLVFVLPVLTLGVYKIQTWRAA